MFGGKLFCAQRAFAYWSVIVISIISSYSSTPGGAKCLSTRSFNLPETTIIAICKISLRLWGRLNWASMSHQPITWDHRRFRCFNIGTISFRRIKYELLNRRIILLWWSSYHANGGVHAEQYPTTCLPTKHELHHKLVRSQDPAFSPGDSTDYLVSALPGPAVSVSQEALPTLSFHYFNFISSTRFCWSPGYSHQEFMLPATNRPQGKSTESWLRHQCNGSY